MKHGSYGSSFRLGAGLAILLVAAACTETGPTSSFETVDNALLTGSFSFIGANSQIGAGATADGELFEVCKRWEGTPATANFTVDGGGGAIAFDDGAFLGPFSDGGVAGGHNDWMCADVWLDGGPTNVAVTETGVSGGANPYTTTVVADGVGGANVQVNGLTVSGNIQGAGGASGIVAFYTNTEEVPPGNEGCTPGYWKQSQHFGNWTGYAQGDSYDATFGVVSSFGGTLLDALKRGGGKENALGRHAVAALLNASSSVNAFYTTAEVIAIVQGAYASGDFNGAKDQLAAANELGCPLGRNP